MCAPGPGSLFSLTTRGEVAVFDPASVAPAADSGGTEAGLALGLRKLDGQFSQDIPVHAETPLVRMLENGFAEGSVLVITMIVKEAAQR
jgi:hypothetical protein